MRDRQGHEQHRKGAKSTEPQATAKQMPQRSRDGDLAQRPGTTARARVHAHITRQPAPNTCSKNHLLQAPFWKLLDDSQEKQRGNLERWGNPHGGRGTSQSGAGTSALTL